MGFLDEDEEGTGVSRVTAKMASAAIDADSVAIQTVTASQRRLFARI